MSIFKRTQNAEQIIQNKIEELKSRLKPKYRKYCAAMDSVGGDCGKSMVYQLRPDLAILRDEINTIFDELAKIDPTCPTSRLS